jgi:two-component system, OmpR family, response regulator
MRILLVEDDKKIATFVIKGLRQENHTVDWAVNGEDGWALLQTQAYDVLIVDLMLPKRDGLSLIQELRQKGRSEPVLILSAKSSVEDRVKGLQTGADDYLVKPFSFSELLARVQALLRRAGQATNGTTLSYADLTLDPLARRVMRGGQVIEMQAREYMLLEYFLRNVGRVLTKTMILEQIYDYAFDPQTNVVDVLVCRLRQKVDRDFNPKLIHTLRGMGYVLRQD